MASGQRLDGVNLERVQWIREARLEFVDETLGLGSRSRY